jgi:hypothetical protein
MKVNKWTMSLAALGLISIPATSLADENDKMNTVWTSLTSTTIKGYVNTSMHWDPGTGNANPPPFAYNAGKQDGFNLNAVKVSIEKPLDEAQWAAGYTFDMIMGPDATTYGTTVDSGGDSSSFAIKQAYVALRAPMGNGLDFKVGVFDTIIGYESFDAGNNPNYTRSWGFTIEPTTHTGMLMSYQINKSISVSAGIANTVGPVINGRANDPTGATQSKAESYKTYMASTALTAPEEWGFMAGSTLYAGFVNGYSSSGPADTFSFYTGLTMNTPVKNLKVGAAFDYLGSTSEFGTGSPYANAWALYTSFQATEKMSLHLRGEYASTDTGLLDGGTGTFTPGNNSEVVSLTATIQYDLWANVLSRLEVRWDHQAGSSEMVPYGGYTSFAGGGGSGVGTAALSEERNAVMVAANLIYKF